MNGTCMLAMVLDYIEHFHWFVSIVKFEAQYIYDSK